VDDTPLVISEAWKRLDLTSMGGVLMVMGAPDVGKSTFARYLFQRLVFEGKRAAYLDGDPGQSVLGPPATITLALGEPGEARFPPGGQVRRWFIGSVSPSGHMLPLLVGAARLVRAAFALGVEVVVYDTSGLIDPAQGGTALKLAKIDLLSPGAVFAIQSGDELESLLIPLRRSQRCRVFGLPTSPEVRRRDVSKRQSYRAERFAAYFHNAQPFSLNWIRLAVFPAPRFSLESLVSLDGADGFVRGLGIVQVLDRKTRVVELLTPLHSLDGVVSLTIGDISLDAGSFRDYRV
jgi:polynucleotide 5'-hydroxyl-kinase GRC3/NOL9